MKILAIFLILLTWLYAQENSFESCMAKMQDAAVFQKDSIIIPIQNSRALIYSKTPLQKKIYKKDPELNLYIVDDTKKFKYPFKLNNLADKELASVTDDSIINGEISKKQVSVSELATFSDEIPAYSLIVTNCCLIEGIKTPDGIIEKEYIQKFLDTKDSVEKVKEQSAIKKSIPQKKEQKTQKSEINQTILGLVFNDKLELIKIEDSAKKYGLKLGDKLLKIDENYVKSKEDIKSKANIKSANLLLQRDGFQFFVKLN